MLTQSPVPPSPSGISPSGSASAFHYASAGNYPQSPSRPLVPPPRRQSSSLAAPGPVLSPPAKPKTGGHAAGVDAATQYSPPMEPVSPLSANRVARRPEIQLATPPVPSQEVVAEEGDQERQAQVQSQAIAPAPSSAKQNPRPAPMHAASPNKRRSSHGAGDASEVAPIARRSPPVLAKRARADAAPPKLLPQRYELCPVEDVVVLIANMLGELIETNDALALQSGHLTRFHSRTSPGISVLDYLHRLAKHATLTPPLLLSMVYYIDRLCVSYPDFTINTLTVHRFLITAATVASKGLSDSFWNNSTYARVGGVRLAELKLLELEFLYRVDWKIVPNPEVLVAYYRGLVERCEGYILQGQDGPDDEDAESGEALDDASDVAGESGGPEDDTGEGRRGPTTPAQAAVVAEAAAAATRHIGNG